MIQEKMGILLGQDHLITACYESLDFILRVMLTVWKASNGRKITMIHLKSSPAMRRMDYRRRINQKVVAAIG